jgi:phage shock protein A
MWKSFRKFWAYLGAVFGAKVEEKADPKIQLEQAIEEAKKRHEALTQQAAAVLGNERQLELKLGRSLEEVEKLQGSARQALLKADQARAAGNEAEAKTFDDAAQAFAMKLVTEEKTAREQKALLEQSEAASEGARKAVESNALNLQKQLAERSKLLSQLDNAKMQERLNDALKQMDELSPSGDVPSVAQVREKIESRYAKALGEADLRSGSLDAKMLEVERAQLDAEAAARLESLRASLGPGGPSVSGGSSSIEVGEPVPDAEDPDDAPAG